MIPLIQQAMVMGYTANQVLSFLGNKVPGMEKGLESARKSYNDQDILNFLKNKIPQKDPEGSKKYSNKLEDYLSSNGIMDKEERTAQRNKGIKAALGFGATALGAYKAYQGYSGIASQLKDYLQPGAEAEAVAPVVEALDTEALGIEGVAGEASGVTEKVLENPLKMFNLEEKASSLLKAGNDPDVVPQILLGLMDKKTKKAYEKALSQGLISPIEESLGELIGGQQTPIPEEPVIQKPIQEDSIPKDPIQEETSIQEPPIQEDLIKKKLVQMDHIPEEPPKVGEEVTTEEGKLGVVKGVSGKNFLIETNGKLEQVPMEQLRAQPKAIKNAKIIFDPSNVKEDLKSSALSMALPLPGNTGIINIYHDGSAYLYKRKDGSPIDEDIVNRIVEGFDIPLTSGETFMGMWDSNKGDSRGSANFKELVRMSQKIDEADDPEKPLHFEKLDNKFIHGYLAEFMGLLKEANRNFIAKPKKPKKPKKKKT